MLELHSHSWASTLAQLRVWGITLALTSYYFLFASERKGLSLAADPSSSLYARARAVNDVPAKAAVYFRAGQEAY